MTAACASTQDHVPASPSSALAPPPWEPVAMAPENAPASTTLSPAPIETRTRSIGGAAPPAHDPRLYGSRGTIDLDLKDADIRDVCRLIADVGNVNIVVGDGVEGRVTIRMKHVRWDRALDAILAAKGFRAEQDGNIVTVLAK